jgi:hypothetical protein
VNLYGFVGGDPVNLSDPFGLCPDKEDPACSIGQRVRAAVDAGIDRALDAIGSVGHALSNAVSALGKDLAVDAALAGIPAVGEVRAGRRVAALGEAVGSFLSESRHLRGINAARKDFTRIGTTADEAVAAIAQKSGWESVSAGALAGGQIRLGTGTVRYTLKSLARGETVLNAWIP